MSTCKKQAVRTQIAFWVANGGPVERQPAEIALRPYSAKPLTDIGADRFLDTIGAGELSLHRLEA